MRERVAMGEILPIWIEGLYNPADTMTKAINAPTTEQHMKYVFGREEIPLPDGVKVWFGPPDAPVLRGNLVPPATPNSANMVQAEPVVDADYVRYEPVGSARLPYDLTAESSVQSTDARSRRSGRTWGLRALIASGPIGPAVFTCPDWSRRFTARGGDNAIRRNN